LSIRERIVVMQEIRMFASRHYRDIAACILHHALQTDVVDLQALPSAAGAVCPAALALDDRTDERIALAPGRRLTARLCVVGRGLRRCRLTLGMPWRRLAGLFSADGRCGRFRRRR